MCFWFYRLSADHIQSKTGLKRGFTAGWDEFSRFSAGFKPSLQVTGTLSQTVHGWLMIHNFSWRWNKLDLRLIRRKSAEKAHGVLQPSVRAHHAVKTHNWLHGSMFARSERVSAAPPADLFINIPVVCGGPANIERHDETALVCHLTSPQSPFYKWLTKWENSSPFGFELRNVQLFVLRSWRSDFMKNSDQRLPSEELQFLSPPLDDASRKLGENVTLLRLKTVKE